MDTTSLRTALNLSLARALVVRSIEAPLSQHGLGFSDLALLLELRNAPGRSLRRVELAARLGVTPSGVARQLGPLERIGLVTRRSHPRDARLALAVLTETGARVVEEAETTAEWAATEALARLWSTADDRDELDRLLVAVPRG